MKELVMRDFMMKGHWDIKIYRQNDAEDNVLTGTVTSDWKSDSFIKYDCTDRNGEIAYDFPERLPKSLKEKVKKMCNRYQKHYEHLNTVFSPSQEA